MYNQILERTANMSEELRYVFIVTQLDNGIYEAIDKELVDTIVSEHPGAVIADTIKGFGKNPITAIHDLAAKLIELEAEDEEAARTNEEEYRRQLDENVRFD